jgi:hypothetical protein
MGVRLAEGDWRRHAEEPPFALVEVSPLKKWGVMPEGNASPRRPPAARRRRLTGRARHIRFTTWTVLAVTLVSVVGVIARPARTASSKGRQSPVTTVATPRAAAGAALHVDDRVTIIVARAIPTRHSVGANRAGK